MVLKVFFAGDKRDVAFLFFSDDCVQGSERRKPQPISVLTLQLYQSVAQLVILGEVQLCLALAGHDQQLIHSSGQLSDLLGKHRTKNITSGRQF